MTDDSTPSGKFSNALDFDPPSVEELTGVLNGYEVLAFLAKGLLGTVYKASQPHLDRLVALKILPSRADEGAQFITRFQREAQTMARLRHDHIMTVHDFGETTDGRFIFIAMEWVEGTTLERAILQENFTHRQILAIITQLCDALHYAHEHGVVHRDIKPANIMLDVNGQVKVADFGLAKVVGAETFENQLTHSIASIGMPDFVAPEQFEPGREIDRRADVYSTGAILYKMLTGYTPRGTFLPPSRKVPDLDPRLDEIVAKAMAADPDRRYAQISQMWHAVAEVHTRPTTASPPAAPAPRKLVTGRVPEKPPMGKPIPEDIDAGPPPPVPKSEKALAVTIVALAGSFALVLAIVAVGWHLSQGDSADPEPGVAVASVPPPRPKSNPNPERRVVEIRRDRPDPAPPPPPPVSKAPPPPSPSLPLSPGKSVNLLAIVDPAKDRLTGDWLREGDALANTSSTGQAKLTLPVVPGGSYMLTAEFTRVEGENSLGFHLPLRGGREVSCFFDHLGGGGRDASGLEYVGGFDVFNEQNPTRVFPGTLETGRRYTAEITVRFGENETVSIAVRLDGRPYFAWEGALASLDIYRGWKQPEPRALGIAVSTSKYLVHELRAEALDDALALSRPVPDSAISAGAAELARTVGAAPPPPPPPPPPPTDAASAPPGPGANSQAKHEETPSGVQRRIAELLAPFQAHFDAGAGSAHSQEITRLQTQYLAAITRAEKTATHSGNLDEVLALRGEATAIGNSAGYALPELPPGAPASLQTLRSTYNEQRVRLDAVRDADAAPLLAAFDEALGKLQQELTRSMQIEEAVAVKAAREKLRAESPFAPGPPGLAAPTGATSGQAPPAPAAGEPPPQFPLPLPFPPSRPTVQGRVAAWDVGSGDVLDEPPPELDGIDDVVDIDCSITFGVALRANGEVIVWGNRDDGRGDVPGDIGDVAAVIAASGCALALRTDGTVIGWGKNANGLESVPRTLRAVSSLHQAQEAVYALRRTGSPVILGVPTFADDGSRENAERASQLVDLAASPEYAVGLRRDGRLRILNDYEDKLGADVRRFVENIEGVVAVACNRFGRQSLALRNNGEVVAWGWGMETDPDFNPVPADLPRDIDAVVVGPGIGGARSRSRDWIFFGKDIDAEKTSARAAGCIDISFLGGQAFGIRP